MHVTLEHADGDKETVVEWSLRHYELRHMGYKEISRTEIPKFEEENE